ncbi:copper transporter [Rhizophagus clarus]|uniref:Copper transporter n=1 Tax=Rhizophagus clarus TaxID=94130 RepID=A0A8H3QXT6_9GLOM|nr:copper transporter [Rhizophagus clarus]
MSETMTEHTSPGHFDHNKLYFSDDLSKISGFQVNSIFSLVLVSIFITILCWSERFLNYYYHKKSIYDRNQNRFRTIVVKTLSYGILTTLRLFYMLLIMSMNSQIFVIVVTGLTTGQLIIEYIRSIPIYQQYTIHPSSEITPNTVESSTLMGNINNYRDEIELESHNFVIEDVNDETKEDMSCDINMQQESKT